MNNETKKPLIIIDQGSFAAGGSVLQTPGTYYGGDHDVKDAI
ncbi:hypothetical protein [Paenibacillus thalictri]|nr:hypothetical protein [Paenibacillus thalictri]